MMVLEFECYVQTRWTVDNESGINGINGIINNFTVLLELWDESLDVVKDSDMEARIQGVTLATLKSL